MHKIASVDSKVTLTTPNIRIKLAKNKTFKKSDLVFSLPL